MGRPRRYALHWDFESCVELGSARRIAAIVERVCRSAGMRLLNVTTTPVGKPSTPPPCGGSWRDEGGITSIGQLSTSHYAIHTWPHDLPAGPPKRFEIYVEASGGYVMTDLVSCCEWDFVRVLRDMTAWLGPILTHECYASWPHVQLLSDGERWFQVTKPEMTVSPVSDVAAVLEQRDSTNPGIGSLGTP